MRRAVLAVLAASTFFGLGCVRLPDGPTQTTQTIVIIAPQPSPSPSPTPPNCGVERVTVGSSLGNTWNVNQESSLTATPFSVSGGSLPQSCTLPVSWALGSGTTAACQLLGSISSFDVTLRCSSAGSAQVIVNVGGTLGFGHYLIK